MTRVQRDEIDAEAVEADAEGEKCDHERDDDDLPSEEHAKSPRWPGRHGRDGRDHIRPSPALFRLEIVLQRGIRTARLSGTSPSCTGGRPPEDSGAPARTRPVR